ncbi:MAG: hypothetical protein IT448_06930 [Phycisphaerales bacterium]|nr:hypothetical protein [Phycisphaerales bacterium]
MINYTLTLLSDAQVGSGLGAGIVDNYVTHDSKGKPVIRSSHIKGLLRQRLTDIISSLPDAGAMQQMLARVLGTAGYRPLADAPLVDDTGCSGAAMFSDAAIVEDSAEAGRDTSPQSSVRLITRTAIDRRTGTAVPGSLRTTQAICAGACFSGSITGPLDAQDECLLQLALLSLEAVGGSRNRGAGLCRVELKNQPDVQPGALLKQLARQALSATAVTSMAVPEDSELKWLDVTFTARSGLLSPDTPEVSNVLESGFAIPASSVRGALLTLINRVNPQAATSCFTDASFRTWPLLPCGLADQQDPLGNPVRVCLTHRAAKHVSTDPVQQASQFADASVDLAARPTDQPMKASDGVLLQTPDKVELWRSREMPRVFTTHGVHSDAVTKGGRNLYSVVAMAPMIYRGLLAIPGKYLTLLEAALRQSNAVSFGKSRTVRGMGTLAMAPAKNDYFNHKEGIPVAFITQSPVLLPDVPTEEPLAVEFHRVVQKWASQFGLGEVEVQWATSGIQFGWNRHGKSHAAGSGRVPAARVVLPGAVFRLKDRNPPQDKTLREAMLAGIGGGADRGFGCVYLHPGKARSLRQRSGSSAVLGTSDSRRSAISRAFEFKTHISASALSAVIDRLNGPNGRKNALDFLDRQGQRGSLFERWGDEVIDKFRKWIGKNDQTARISLEILYNLAVARDQKHRERH